MSLLESNRIFIVRLVSSMIHQLMTLYGIFQIYKTQGSPIAAGLVGLFLFIPSLIAPVLSIKVLNRIKNVGVAFTLTHILYGFAIILILTNTQDNLLIWYLAAFVASFARSIRVPLHYEILKQNQQKINRVAILNNLSWQLPIIISPLLLSLMHSHYGPMGIKITLVILSIAVITLSYPLRRIKRSQINPIATQSLFRESMGLLSGTLKIWLPAIADLVIMIMASLPLIIATIIANMKFDEHYYGMLISFPMLITVFSVIFLAPKLLQLKTSLSLGFSFVGIAVGFTVILVNQELIALIIGLFLVAVFDGISIVVRDKLLINESRSSNVGLVSSINAILISGADELGQAFTGLGLQTGGLQFNMGFSAFLAFSIGLTYLIYYFTKYSLPHSNAQLKEISTSND